ncbi:MAG: FtsW/RodA/SpoVE family cell cycle protein [Oscillospiraceae bacterium]|nr:FtsW/RodA/SpoVE family cell cycle protein [Oscillospiraceae bacterium]
MAARNAERRHNYILSAENRGSRVKHAPVPVNDINSAKVKKKKVKEPGLRIYDGNIDSLFFVIIIVLLVFGIIMMFSASYVAGLAEGDGYKYVKTQGMAAVIGILAMIFISFFDYHILMNSKVVTFGFLAVLALLTYTSFFGEAVAGARRWIEIGSFSVQPSEIMKVALIIYMSHLICKNDHNLGSFTKGVIPLCMVMGVVCANMVLQRHISGLLIMCALGAVVIFVGGMPWKQIFQLIGIIVAAALVFMLLYSAFSGGGLSYITDRFASSEELESGDTQGAYWQITQSLIAIGSGGWLGLGFGESRQKYLWLPESQNDFIFPIIVEELGYLGGLVVIFLFVLFIYRGFYIARKAPDKFGMLIVMGITFQIGLQAILNIGVACNAFPNTGISLPFFSSGGTALVIQLAEMGVILGVSRQCDI